MGEMWKNQEEMWKNQEEMWKKQKEKCILFFDKLNIALRQYLTILHVRE